MSAWVYVSVPVMVVLGILQTAVLPHFPIFGYVPILPFLVALAWGLLAGLNEGMIWAFVGGLFTDLFSIVPVGVSALAFMAAIMTVVLLQQALPVSRFVLPILLAGLATFIYLLVYFVLLQLFGLAPPISVAASFLPLIVLHGALVLPVYWLLYLVNQKTSPRRVEI